jgi:hypothetical protein
MEINFTEIPHNSDHTSNNFVNHNYWETNSNMNNNINNENNENNENKKKKKVTYDDILSSLNLVVAPNGVLQYMSTKPNTFNREGDYEEEKYEVKPKSILKKTVYHNEEKIEPQVKHSYIFNKYFKNYKEPNAIEEPLKPMTREEYQKMVIEDLIKRKLAQKRVAQIKSKKMAFTNNNNQTIYASKNNLNHLFRF